MNMQRGPNGSLNNRRGQPKDSGTVEVPIGDEGEFTKINRDIFKKNMSELKENIMNCDFNELKKQLSQLSRLQALLVALGALLVLKFLYGLTVSEVNPLEEISKKPHFLEKLLYKYGSDKSHDDHGYSDFYQMIFDPIRHNVANVTEIGIAAGQSLQTWYHYFPNAKIWGYDVQTLKSVRRIVDQLKSRVNYTEMDLASIDLEAFGLHDETMDVIIEDASHKMKQQQDLLEKTFRLVKPGGYYIIEDIVYTNEKSRNWHQDPDKLNPKSREIIQNHDTIFIDAHIGHRDWKEWMKRSGPKWVVNHLEHDSYLVVIHKRHEPVRPVQMNFGKVAMKGKQVKLDEDMSDPLGENN